MKTLLALSTFALVLALGLATSSQNILKFLQKVPKANDKYTDCQARWNAGERIPGVYTIYPNGTYPVEIYCNHTEMQSFTVIQRRIYGDVNFYRGWNDYKHGFGNVQGDYWAGLETIYHLTKSGKATLRIDLQDWSGNKRNMQYSKFIIGSESQRYMLTIGGPSGHLKDDMAFSNKMMFYTYDSPDHNHCATNQKVGWWYNYCSYALLNGIYYYGGPYTPTGGFYDGIYWMDWMGYGYSLKFVSMTLYHK